MVATHEMPVRIEDGITLVVPHEEIPVRPLDQTP